jgi:hypothetical protein
MLTWDIFAFCAFNPLECARGCAGSSCYFHVFNTFSKVKGVSVGIILS